MRSGAFPAAPATEEFTKDDFAWTVRLLAELKEIINASLTALERRH